MPQRVRTPLSMRRAMFLSYVTWLDGVGHKRWGTPGVMATDAAANGAFGIILLLVAIVAGRHWHDRRKVSGCKSLITVASKRNHTKPRSGDLCMLLVCAQLFNWCWLPLRC